jgi:hypothetical protein
MEYIVWYICYRIIFHRDNKNTYNPSSPFHRYISQESEEETNMTQTIGQAADKLAQEYFTLYQTLRKDFDKEQAQNLALHDLVVKQLVAEFAQEKLKQLIAKVNA